MSLQPAATNAKVWIRCSGYFSEVAYDGDVWIGIDSGKIVRIESRKPKGVDEFDSCGITEALYAAPLLADTHGHVYMEPWPLNPADRSKPGSKPFEEEVEDALTRVDNALANGVGLIRDMGDPHGVNLEVKRRLACRSQPSLELLAPGPAFHRPKKYGRYLGVRRESVEDVKNSIRELHARGEIDYVKIVATGIVNFAEKRMNQTPQYTLSELSDIVALSHDLGYKVAAHCSGEDGLDLCIEASVDFIEHAYFVTEEQIDRMTEKGLVWTPTFAPVHAQGANDECGWSDADHRSIEEILTEHSSKIAYGRSRGTTILAGTDAGSPGVELGRGLRIELGRLAAAGYDAPALLEMATITNGAACGARSYSSKIEVGAKASFALYEKAPWEKIENLDTLKHVICEGETIR